MEKLTYYLRSVDPGPVEMPTHLERLSAKVWDDLAGDQGGVTGHKLLGRTEHVEWNTPLLTFQIERHGRTVNCLLFS